MTDIYTLLNEWRDNPILFIEDVFDEEPDPQQAEVLRALASYPRVAVRSGHGVGKTWTATRAALWFLLTHSHAKVITTAPTWPQVRQIMWSEIHSAIRKMPKSLRSALEVLDTEIYVRDTDGSRVKDWFIIGRSSDKPENMQGFHAQNLLFILDEASGIQDEIYEAIEGTQTTNAKMLLIGNPTKPAGFFYSAFHERQDLWETFHISCVDSPRVSPKWIKAMEREWGKDSAVFKVRVLGEFPEAAENAIFPLSWIENAIKEPRHVEDGTIHIGVDVARMGLDETVLTVIRVNGDSVEVLEIQAERKKETTWTARRAKRLYEKYGADAVNVDDVGVGGGVTDLLREENVPVNPINFGARPTRNADIYLNLKAQLYFKLRDYFNPETEGWIRIPEHAKLIRDLSAMRVDYTSKDKIKIIDPPKSPDYADSLVIALASIGGLGGTGLPPVIT